MISPAWAHRERVRKAEAAKAAKVALDAADKEAIKEMASGNEKFAVLLRAIEGECKRISDLPKGSARTDLKRNLIAIYLPVVKKYIDGDDEYENTVLTQVLVWLFDCGEIGEALKIAAVAIEQEQPMPSRFKSNVKTFVADSVMEWAKAQFDSGNSVEPYFGAMLADISDWSVHDDIKLKYVKLAADIAHKDGDIDKALELCIQAEEIAPGKSAFKSITNYKLRIKELSWLLTGARVLVILKIKCLIAGVFIRGSLVRCFLMLIAFH